MVCLLPKLYIRLSQTVYLTGIQSGLANLIEFWIKKLNRG